MSFGSGTGVPPVNGHGQDGRATANDTAPDARNGRTMSGFAAFVLLATRHSSLLFAAFVLLDTGHSSLATAFENSDYLSDHQSTATYKFVGVTLSIGKQAKSIDVVIVEKRGSTELVSDHFQCKGCNFCAGLISPRLNKIFEAHD
ncbi:MAG TPA: hypothetical protein VEN79_05980, partial [Terriglobia bacterium]|nr:hypothetical protein [Terriglobia bacterium]